MKDKGDPIFIKILFGIQSTEDIPMDSMDIYDYVSQARGSLRSAISFTIIGILECEYEISLV